MPACSRLARLYNSLMRDTDLRETSTPVMNTFHRETVAPKPLFADLADTTLARVKDTYTQRGEQYGDTWKQCVFVKLRAVLSELYGNMYLRLDDVYLEELRAIALAAYIDMKYARSGGGYSDDHGVDGIAYEAALAEQMRRVI